MTTILLADDDLLSLNRISGMIFEMQSEYELIGQARNGKDCLKAVAELHPDILILDIDMPVKNGVEVSKALKECNATVKILILSNYDDFAFVRDAMKYGAVDYLLKHQITAPVLAAKLSEARRLMEQEGIKQSRNTFLSHMADRECLRYLIDHDIPRNAVLSAELGCFAAPANVLSVMQITNFILVTHFSSALNREKLILSILNLGGSICNAMQNGVMIHIEYGQFALCFRYREERSSQEILTQSASHMRLLAANIQKLFGLTAMWQISDIVHESSRFHDIYQQITRQLNQQSFAGSPSTAAAQRPLRKPLPVSASLPDSIGLMDEKALSDALSEGDMRKAAEALERMLLPYSREGVCLTQQAAHQLLAIGLRFQKEHQIQFTAASDAEFQSIDYSRLSGQQTLDFFMDFFRKLVQSASPPESADCSPHVKRAITYIREHYSDDISQSSLAEELGITTTHLSHLFKKETGISFIDYLTDYRIGRARQLLRSSTLELKEIAEKTGFNGYNYFLKVYKDKTGKTPSQEMSSRKRR